MSPEAPEATRGAREEALVSQTSEQSKGGWNHERKAEKGQEKTPSSLRLEGASSKTLKTAETHIASFGLGWA